MQVERRIAPRHGAENKNANLGFDAGQTSCLLYVAAFFLFSLQIVPNDILMIALLVVFLQASMKTTALLYIFSLPWSEVATFSFGLTLSLAQSVVYILKIVWIKRKLRMSIIDVALFGHLVLVSIINFLFFSSFNGISIVIYFVIATVIFYEYILDQENDPYFLRDALFFLTISVLLAGIFGITAETALPRWLRDIGIVWQFYGTLGTTRFGMYLCIGLIYALFYVKSLAVKLMLSLVLTIGIFATVSVMAVLLMLCVYLYYFFFSGKDLSLKGSVFTVLLALGGILAVVLAWDYLQQLPVIRPIDARIESIIGHIRAGELDAVTTGRETLGRIHMEKFTHAPIFCKLFGSASYAVVGAENYSHNSYIDMLNYSGIAGCILFGLLQVKRYVQYKNLVEFRQIFLIKVIVGLMGMTVSVFSAQYWLVWFCL